MRRSALTLVEPHLSASLPFSFYDSGTRRHLLPPHGLLFTHDRATPTEPGTGDSPRSLTPSIESVGTYRLLSIPLPDSRNLCSRSPFKLTAWTSQSYAARAPSPANPVDPETLGFELPSQTNLAGAPIASNPYTGGICRHQGRAPNRPRRARPEQITATRRSSRTPPDDVPSSLTSQPSSSSLCAPAGPPSLRLGPPERPHRETPEPHRRRSSKRHFSVEASIVSVIKLHPPVTSSSPESHRRSAAAHARSRRHFPLLW
ncbi:uncharacterized protein [Triticum aestivum]|uniref:uncharacterized protein n=1 Tax=Triticum aestivum TaxID=4565 RepID=UPI001D018215|nr:uncharacterized protein LOC123120453 [Triticum aestivum]